MSPFSQVPTLASKILDMKPDWLPAMKGIGIGNPGIENDWYYNVNEYAFLTFAYSHAIIPQVFLPRSNSGFLSGGASREVERSW